MVVQLILLSAILLPFECISCEENCTAEPPWILYMTIAISGDLNPSITPFCYSAWKGWNRVNASDSSNDIPRSDDEPRVDGDEESRETTFLSLGFIEPLDPYSLPKFITLSDEPSNEAERNVTRGDPVESDDLTYVILGLPGCLHDKVIPSSIHITTPHLSEEGMEGSYNSTSTKIRGEEMKKCPSPTHLCFGFPGWIDLKQMPISMRVYNPKRKLNNCL